MPFGPASLPWWGWLLCAAGGSMATFIAWALSDADDNFTAGCLAVLLGIATFFVGVLGVVQFVKWAWGG